MSAKKKNKAAVHLGRLRASKWSAEQRVELAKRAVAARWAKVKKIVPSEDSS